MNEVVELIPYIKGGATIADCEKCDGEIIALEKAEDGDWLAFCVGCADLTYWFVNEDGDLEDVGLEPSDWQKPKQPSQLQRALKPPPRKVEE